MGAWDGTSCIIDMLKDDTKVEFCDFAWRMFEVLEMEEPSQKNVILSVLNGYNGDALHLKQQWMTLIRNPSMGMLDDNADRFMDLVSKTIESNTVKQPEIPPPGAAECDSDTEFEQGNQDEPFVTRIRHFLLTLQERHNADGHDREFRALLRNISLRCGMYAIEQIGVTQNKFKENALSMSRIERVYARAPQLVDAIRRWASEKNIQRVSAVMLDLMPRLWLVDSLEDGSTRIPESHDVVRAALQDLVAQIRTFDRRVRVLRDILCRVRSNFITFCVEKYGDSWHTRVSERVEAHFIEAFQKTIRDNGCSIELTSDSAAKSKYLSNIQHRLGIRDCAGSLALRGFACCMAVWLESTYMISPPEENGLWRLHATNSDDMEQAWSAVIGIGKGANTKAKQILPELMRFAGELQSTIDANQTLQRVNDPSSPFFWTLENMKHFTFPSLAWSDCGSMSLTTAKDMVKGTPPYHSVHTQLEAHLPHVATSSPSEAMVGYKEAVLVEPPRLLRNWDGRWVVRAEERLESALWRSQSVKLVANSQEADIQRAMRLLGRASSLDVFNRTKTEVVCRERPVPQDGGCELTSMDPLERYNFYVRRVLLASTDRQMAFMPFTSAIEDDCGNPFLPELLSKCMDNSISTNIECTTLSNIDDVFAVYNLRAWLQYFSVLNSTVMTGEMGQSLFPISHEACAVLPEAALGQPGYRVYMVEFESAEMRRVASQALLVKAFKEKAAPVSLLPYTNITNVMAAHVYAPDSWDVASILRQSATMVSQIKNADAPQFDYKKLDVRHLAEQQPRLREFVFLSILAHIVREENNIGLLSGCSSPACLHRTEVGSMIPMLSDGDCTPSLLLDMPFAAVSTGDGLMMGMACHMDCWVGWVQRAEQLCDFHLGMRHRGQNHRSKEKSISALCNLMSPSCKDDMKGDPSVSRMADVHWMGLILSCHMFNPICADVELHEVVVATPSYGNFKLSQNWKMAAAAGGNKRLKVGRGGAETARASSASMLMFLSSPFMEYNRPLLYTRGILTKQGPRLQLSRLQFFRFAQSMGHRFLCEDDFNGDDWDIPMLKNKQEAMHLASCYERMTSLRHVSSSIPKNKGAPPPRPGARGGGTTRRKRKADSSSEGTVFLTFMPKAFRMQLLVDMLPPLDGGSHCGSSSGAKRLVMPWDESCADISWDRHGCVILRKGVYEHEAVRLPEQWGEVQGVFGGLGWVVLERADMPISSDPELIGTIYAHLALLNGNQSRDDWWMPTVYIYLARCICRYTCDFNLTLSRSLVNGITQDFAVEYRAKVLEDAKHVAYKHLESLVQSIGSSEHEMSLRTEANKLLLAAADVLGLNVTFSDALAFLGRVCILQHVVNIKREPETCMNRFHINHSTSFSIHLEQLSTLSSALLNYSERRLSGSWPLHEVNRNCSVPAHFVWSAIVEQNCGVEFQRILRCFISVLGLLARQYPSVVSCDAPDEYLKMTAESISYATGRLQPFADAATQPLAMQLCGSEVITAAFNESYLFSNSLYRALSFDGLEAMRRSTGGLDAPTKQVMSKFDVVLHIMKPRMDLLDFHGEQTVHTLTFNSVKFAVNYIRGYVKHDSYMWDVIQLKPQGVIEYEGVKPNVGSPTQLMLSDEINGRGVSNPCMTMMNFKMEVRESCMIGIASKVNSPDTQLRPLVTYIIMHSRCNKVDEISIHRCVCSI